ncbi:ABC transporter ATP-binding protein [Vallitalea okinawensis]|uniref:ABC transporter ATP-binding protein n=1 Tax=Vallitalea okinawensis TaxID=2078660 RepID=UPI0013005074|nr:ATP-binding cassette domain-containing protein [Vallitalea okinawensis]
MIDVKSVTLSFKDKDQNIQVLNNVSMSIEKGRIAVLIGPSGIGKTTLLKTIAGILKDYNGQVLIADEQVDPKKHRVGFITQGDGLIPWKKVKENITLAARIKDGKNNIDQQLMSKINKQLKIDNLLNRYPKQLSGGEKQRVAMARSFLLKPQILLMDEPFSALDDLTKEEARQLFLEIWKNSHVTTLLVTHNLREALYLGQEIWVLTPQMKGLKCIENPVFGWDYREKALEIIEAEKKLSSLLGGKDV